MFYLVQAIDETEPKNASMVRVQLKPLEGGKGLDSVREERGKAPAPGDIVDVTLVVLARPAA